MRYLSNFILKVENRKFETKQEIMFETLNTPRLDQNAHFVHLGTVAHLWDAKV
jgi:hypothetical protein